MPDEVLRGHHLPLHEPGRHLGLADERVLQRRRRLHLWGRLPGQHLRRDGLLLYVDRLFGEDLRRDRQLHRNTDAGDHDLRHHDLPAGLLLVQRVLQLSGKLHSLLQRRRRLRDLFVHGCRDDVHPGREQ